MTIYNYSFSYYHKTGDSKACVRLHVVSLHVSSPHAACPNYQTELDFIYKKQDLKNTKNVKGCRDGMPKSMQTQRRRRHFKSGQATANKRSLVHVEGGGGSTTGNVWQ